MRAHAVCRVQERFRQSTTRFRSKGTTARQLASLAVIAAAAMLPVSAAYAAKKPPLV
ncbi:hypothetical protein B1F68_26300, partial [Pseudomonas syringae]